MSRRLRELEARLDELIEQSTVVPERRITLTVEERREIASRWSQIVCTFCGGWHGGLCNRIRRIELDEAGRSRRTVFWDHWEQNPHTIWPEDVWESTSTMVTDFEAQARTRASEAEIQRTAAREAELARRESQRPETARELAARVLGERRQQ